MSWIRKTTEPNTHKCSLPMKDQTIRLHPSHVSTKGRSEFEIAQDKRRGFVEIGTRKKIPDGRIGDVWECDACGTIWLIDVAPTPRPMRYGYSPRYGTTAVWAKASWWQRRRYRKLTPEERHG